MRDDPTPLDAGPRVPDAERARFARVREVFAVARRLSREERRARLHALCGGDSALAAEVEMLLAGHDAETAGGDAGPAVTPLAAGLRAAIADVLSPSPAAGDAPVPDRIGPYRIVRRIGVGGMGTVYEAEEQNPRRRVALKVIRPELENEEVRRRFEFEAQVSARLEHPGIARIYAAGRGEGPHGPCSFIAMELVEGRTPQEHAAALRLDVRGKLELVARLCDAVGYAHQRGVIHRDLKPSNVLVDERGQPKILDFGVARLVEGAAGETSLHTRFGRIIGTLAYMSPEQAAGDPDAVDTRSDIHAIGVIAYELLCGRLPHAIESQPLHLAIQTLVERDPPTLGAVDAALRGDVSILVGHAMEKERARRYPSANAFADDIRRFLRDEPILARPSAAAYHVRKFARRHKGLVAGLATALLALVAGLVAALVLASEREDARRLADAASRTSVRSAYRAEIAAAAAALKGQDPATARRRLGLADPSQRGWEWRWLSAQIDLEIASVPLAVETSGPFRFNTASGVLGAGDEAGRLHRIDVATGKDLGEPQAGTGSALGQIFAVPGSARFVGIDLDGRLFVWGDGGAGAGAPLTFERPPLGIGVGPEPAHAVVAVPSPPFSKLPPSLRLVDVDTGKESARFDGMQAWVGGAVFSKDGKTFATAGFDRAVRTWDTVRLQPLAKGVGHGHDVFCVAFSPEGTELASGSGDGTARIWDAATGAERLRLKGHSGYVTDLVFSRDGRRLATASPDGTVRAWNLGGGTAEAVAPAAPATLLGFDETGERLRGVSAGAVRTWLVSPERKFDVLRGHRTPEQGNVYPYVYGAAWSPDGARIVSCAWDGTVRLWEPATGRLLATLSAPGFVYAVSFARGGRVVAAATSAGAIHTWDAGTGAPLARREGATVLSRGTTAVRPDGEALLFVGADQSLHLVDAGTLADLQVWAPPAPGQILGAAWSPDGRTVAVASSSWVCLLLDARDGRVLRTLRSHTNPVAAAAFSPDGKTLATAGQDAVVCLWPLDREEPPRVLRGHTSRVYSLAFSPDGTRLASGANDATIRLWDPDRGDELLEITGHEAYVFSLAFSPDGDRLLSASGDDTLRVWSTLPLAARWAAAERERALETEVEPDVARRLRDADPAAVVAALESDPALDAVHRRAALAVALRLATAK